MSRRDQLFQTFAAVQDSVYQLIDEHASSFIAPYQQASTASTSSNTAGPSSHSATATAAAEGDAAAASAPPLYHQQPVTGLDDNDVPEEVLHSAPGRAQEILDQMPRTRMAKGDAREARRAAAALRQEQLRSGALKTRHSFASQNGRVLLDIVTPPQKMLTFMGGSEQRGGNGAIRGKVTVHAQDGDRVSAIRLKIKAVARVQVPRQSTPQSPFPLSQVHPSTEPCVEKEVLLLQLESKLYTANKERASTIPAVEDPTVLTKGSHDFAFTIDLPSQTAKGEALPPSFVLQPVVAPHQGQQQRPRQGGSGLDDVRGKVAALTSALPLPGPTTEWGSIKWYAKLTVERPGLFKTNERVFAPFVYLPPPPPGKDVEPLLHRRMRLAAEIEATLRASFVARNARTDATAGLQMMLDKLVEPLGQWEAIRLNDPSRGGKGKKKSIAPAPSKGKDKDGGPGRFSKLLFGAQVNQTTPNAPTSETWTLFMPKKPKVFPLRSGIPYLLVREIEWKGHILDETALSRVPSVALYQRTRTYARGKGPHSGHLIRTMSVGRQSPDADPMHSVDYSPTSTTARSGAVTHRRKDSYLGLIELPPTCSPCFDTAVLTLEYFVGIQLARGGAMAHTEPVVLCCPPPMKQPAAPKPRTTTTGNGQRRRRITAANNNTPSASTSNVSTRPPAVSRTSTTASSAKTTKPSASSRVSAAAAQTPPPPPQPASRPRPSQQQQTVASSSSRPTAQSGRSGATTTVQHNHGYPEEKRRMAPPPSSASTASVTPAPPSRSSHHAPVPQPASAAATPPTRSTASSVAGHSYDGHDDDDDDQDEDSDDDDIDDGATSSTGHTSSHDDSHAWRFAEDDLVTDLPPSYFEATGVQDRDD